MCSDLLEIADLFEEGVVELFVGLVIDACLLEKAMSSPRFLFLELSAVSS